MTTSLIPARGRGLRERAWRAAELLTGALMPADTLDVLHPLRPGADQLAGRVEQVHLETPDAATVTIKPGADWAGHVPGQYLRLGVDIDGVRNWRTYSLTSLTRAAGRTDGLLTITTKAIPGGRVSNHIVHALRPGTLVHLGQAEGEFVLPSPRPAKVLFLTGGSGITPVMGMLRNHVAELPDVVMVHSAPSARDVIFAEELRELGSTGLIRLVELHTDSDGMLDLAVDLDRLVPDWREREVWACGPTGMLDACEIHWDAAALAERLHVERFRPHLVVTGEGGTVTFVKTGTVVESDGSRPILDVAEEAGMIMPHGCRMGICFQCVLPLREGAVRDLRTGDLTYAAPGDGVAIQTCVSAAAGACEIDH
ncbi:MAG: ferredoxin reductase [Candidatus Phosphoribacter sp.]